MTSEISSPLTLNQMVQVVTSPAVARRALSVALIVGPILTLINQGDRLFGSGDIIWWKVMLTFMVPYCVSTSTSFLVARDTHARKLEGASPEELATAAADPGVQALPCPSEILPTLSQAVGTLNTISTNAGTVQMATSSAVLKINALEESGDLAKDVATEIRDILHQATTQASTNQKLAQQTGDHLSDTKDLVETTIPTNAEGLIPASTQPQ